MIGIRDAITKSQPFIRKIKISEVGINEKNIIVFSVILLVFGVTACSQNEETQDKNELPNETKMKGKILKRQKNQHHRKMEA